MFGTTSAQDYARVINDAVNYCQQEAIYGFCKNSTFKFGHASSTTNADLSRFVSNLSPAELAATELDKVARDILGSSFVIERAYINVYFLSTPTAVHADDQKDKRVTFLYYANPVWLPDWAGETVLYTRDGKEITQAVLPAPGRIAIFDSTQPHASRPPSILAQAPKFTIAIKGEIA